MTLTVAHISPIISLVAGVLILIMPRLLNLIVAVFLFLNGLIGLGSSYTTAMRSGSAIRC